MATLPASGHLSNAARTVAELKADLDAIRDVSAETEGGAARAALTIAAGVITPTTGVGGGHYTIETEAAAASDTLDTVAQTNTRDGQVITLWAVNAAHVVTINNNAGGAGQLLLTGGVAFTLDSLDKWIRFARRGTNWTELDRSYGADVLAQQAYLKMPNVYGHNTLCGHDGLLVSRPAAATLSIAARSAVLADANGNLRTVRNVGQTINLAATGTNGRDVVDNAGAEQASTWYHLFIIARDDGVLSVFASQVGYPGSGTSIHSRLPAGYVWAGYVGAAYNDGSSNLIDFYQRGDEVVRAPLTILSGGAATTLTSVSAAAAVPVTARMFRGSANVLATAGNPAGNMSVAAHSSGLGQIDFFNAYTATGNGQGGAFEVAMENAQQIFYSKSGSVTASITVNGWRF